MSILKELTGQLGKIKFIFYEDSKKPKLGKPYSPAYNPTSFSVSHSVEYDESKSINKGQNPKKYTNINPRSVSMELFFDGTGASPNLVGTLTNAIGIPTINSVDLQIKTFLNFAYKIKGTKHTPQYVMIVWGSFIMTGVLKSANVTYKMFAPDGRPLRATMSIVIDENIEPELTNKILNLLSPDLSKSIIVKEGDTLPLLCAKEYDDASLYPKVAAVNKLKNYRKLKQGMELLFPPIDNLA
jgi:nucleoid-associated protein YgaU